MGSVPTIGQPDDLSSTLPAAPSGSVNNIVQAEAPTALPTTVVRHFSSYTPPATATTPGAVPTPPNNTTEFLRGDMTYAVPPGTGGGGGGTAKDCISFYLSPATITPPTLSTWAYHTNASYGFNVNGAMVLSTFSSSAGEILGESISNEDFDIIGCFAVNQPINTTSGNVNIAGIDLWDSVSGKHVRFFFNMTAAGDGTLTVQHVSSFTGSGSNAYNVGMYWGSGVPIWLRINCSHGLFTFYLSVDGQSWDEAFQESATAYLPVAATNAGILIYVSATTVVHFVVPHFVVSSYVGS